MKQNLLFNQASAIGKRIAMVLTMLLIVGIGQAWGADTWTLVKDVNELAVGDEVVIAASGSNYALGTTQNNNNRAAVSITKNGDNITWTTAVQVLTLKEGTVSGTFAFYTGSGYLYAASSSNNYLKTQSTNNANGSWKITITAAGVATIKASGTNSRNWLRFNSSNSPVIFSCYSSGQNDVAIYKKQATVTKTLSSITLSGQTTTYNVGDNFSFDGTCTANYSDGSTKAVTPTSVSSPDMNNAGTPTITVSYTEGSVTVKATYTITVTAPAGGDDDGDCEYVWELVTDDTTLQPLDKVIITASGDNKYALSTNQKSSNRGATAITKNGDLLENTSADVQILTLVEVPGSTGVFAFLAEGVGYLYAASSTGNQLKTRTALDDNGKWTITISDGIASIVATASLNRNVMQYNYNNGSPLFSCYASANQTSLAIYKKTCITETAPSLNASESSLSFGEVTVNSSKELTFKLSGSDLKANATLAISGRNAGMFSVTPTSVTPSNGSFTDQTITVTYTPTAKASHSATLTISSEDAEDLTISLAGTGKAQTATYTVNHYQQNIADDNYTLKETQTLSAEVGTQVTPLVKSYTGFNAPATQTVTIKLDGSTVVTYEYTRNSYTLTWDVNEGNALTGSYTSGSVKYGAAITKPAEPTREGHVFKGWHNGTSIVTPATTMPASNLTYTAQWTPTYTITWLANGQEFHKQENAVEGTALDVPDSELDASEYACDDKVFVGWTATPINGSTDTEPADLFTTKNINVEAASTPYYAVFATADGGGVENVDATLSFERKAQRTTFTTSQQVWTQNGITLTNNKASSTNNVGDYSNPARFYKSSNITITAPGNITQIVFTCNTEAYATSLATSIGDSDLASGTIVTLILDGASDSYEVTLSDGQVRMNSLTVTYTTGSGTSYSDYSTVCEAIPDPVWGGAVINRNSIKVDCGSMTKLNAADPNGPATISFPAATNHTLTYDITVTASEGFRVSTNKTDAAKYGASVTVSPNKTGDNAGKITQNVYVVAVAPAMSDEGFTGTITLSGKQLAENQVIDVTADVTCTTYTLTLNDRGTKTTAEYYAGASVPKPADPEGVCTDPINYVFDGWSLDPVTDENTTSYEEVTFPFDMPAGKTTLYAVYRYVEEGSGDSGDYVKLTEDLDDYSGDYLIVYEAGSLALNGALVGDGLDASGNSISVAITDNTIVATDEVNASNFTIAKEDDGYSIRSASGYYIGQTTNGNDLKTNSTEYYANTITLADDDNVDIVSSGAYLRYNAATGNTNLRFRYYKSDSYTSQKAIALYRKAASYLYTTSPVCGPHLAITEGKEIYVTGGNAGGTRDLVIAQQKVSYKATRLNVGPTSQVPDVKVATNGITVGGVVTSDVKVTIDQTKEQQTDGTYTITGTITVQYQPSANNKQEDIQVQLAVDYNAEARDNFTVHARSLPSEFVIVAKSGDKWYALNGDMANGSSANPANGQVTLDDDANPTKATYAPCNTIYTFDGVPNTGDRTYVRFQGTDGAWLWASSGNNVGIQNNVLKTTPEGSNKAYNWKLYTEDNITYRFGNANSSRQLTLNGEKFGMYASGVQDIRILPYKAKCLYNYAPTNLKVSVLKGTYVTLTWDAVAGATKYQYSTNGTTWTDCGTEPTVTINGLTGATKYTYYIRAYHEDASVSQECIDYAEITFTTADCDDVPTNITYTADLNSITVSWTAAAPTATIKLYTNADGTGGCSIYPSAKSPYRISGGLDKNTTYYLQIFSDGTCASPIVPVKTEDVEVDIVEWQPQGIVVDINTDETIGVTLENEVSYGSGLGTEATELFFSKYYEASYNVKLVAIYNGTKNIIDLTDYIIKYGKTSWETNYITLKDFGATKGQIQPGEEIILYSYTENNADDKKILDCVHKDFPDGNWVRVTSSNNTGKGTLSFAGDKTLALFKGADIIDIIGAVNGSNPNNSKANEKPTWGDANGWICATGLSLADDSEIGISTNRCLLIRNNTVTSGENAVTQNIDDFVTLCTEWKGAQVPDSDIDNGVAASCENFAYVGTFDYSDYYTKYVPMGEGTTFDKNARNADGTVTIPITDLYKHSCSNIRVKLTNSNGDVLSDREYKVPIMITSDQTTAGQAFLDLQQNLATKEVDAEGNVINTYPLSLDEVREICKTCDVVVRDNATLTKVTDGTTNDHPQVHDVIVYEGASIVIPDGINHNYTINSLALRRKGDEVASAQVQGTGKFVLPAEVPVTLSMRIDANNWHWFTLPYNCDIADVTWSDGTEAKYNTDWFLMYYDGESRSNQQSNYESHWKVYNGTTIEAGKGYIIGITGDLTHPDYTFELRFPMAQEVLAAEQTDKTVAVNAWGVKKDIRPNHKGWNLVGNPYMDYYQPNTNGFAGLPLIKYLSTNSAGEWLYDDSGTVPFLVIPQNGGWSEYKQELASDVDMQPFTAYFVQVGDPANEGHSDGMELNASFEADKRGRSSLIRRAPSEVDELEEPAIVAVSLTNAKGESDKTTLLIADRFTNEYEMNADFFKWFGDYYTYYTKPVLYTLGADKESRAFNALNEELAAQPVALGMYAAQAGNYTFSLHQRSNLTGVAEVWLHDASNNTHTNLLQDDYTFSTSKTNGSGRFSLSVKMIQKLPTDVENIKQGNVWATTQDNEIVINGLTKDMQLWIYDATGKLVHADRSTNYQHSYSVSQTGAYFIRVQNKNGAQTIKVVVE